MRRAVTVSVIGIVAAALTGTSSAGGSATSVRRVSASSPFAGSQNPDCASAANKRGWEWETSIAVDPWNPNHRVVAWLQDDAISIVVASTRDGGRTWRQAPVPGLTKCTGGTYAVDYHPRLVWSADGTLYLLSHPAQGPFPADPHAVENGILVSSSMDGGRTWTMPQTPTTLPGLVDFDNGIAEPDTGALDVVWTEPETTGGDPIFVSRTVDRGATWSRVLARVGAPGTVSHNTLLAGHQGKLLLLSQDEPITNTLAGTTLPAPLYAVRSSDSGATWSSPVRVTDASTAEWPTAAMARDSSVHLVTRRKDANHSVLELRSSRDDGATWSEPTRVLSLTDGEVALPQPSLAITQRGALAVLHYDYVSSERLQIRARISRSLDGGATWRVTPVGEPFNYASIPDYRDGNALGFFNTVVAAGNDVTASVVLGGQQATSGPDDVFVATVRGS